MALRNVLIAAYHFPPMGGSGVQRVLKWTKYLPREGWRPHVVCAGHDDHALADHTLTRDIDPCTSVTRPAGWEPVGVAARVGRGLRSRRVQAALAWRLNRLADRLQMPEREALWVGAAIRASQRIVRRERIEAVITSGPPHSTHRVGLRLRRRLGLPWIADLRDALCDNWATQTAGRTMKAFLVALESEIARHADHLIVTCPEVGHALCKRHQIASTRISFIPNGYDPEDAPPPETKADANRFVIAHVGALYREQRIAPVIVAINEFLRENPTWQGKLELRIVGSLSTAQRSELSALPAPFLSETGYLPHEAAIREMQAAHALLLMTPENAAGRFCIPAKTFEYLAFGGRILAVVHGGTELERLLLQSGQCTVVASHSPAEIAAGLKACMEQGLSRSTTARRDLPAAYRRDHQAATLARIVERIVDGRSAPRISAEHANPVEAA